jgi:hypothetical protein
VECHDRVLALKDFGGQTHGAAAPPAFVCLRCGLEQTLRSVQSSQSQESHAPTPSKIAPR